MAGVAAPRRDRSEEGRYADGVSNWLAADDASRLGDGLFDVLQAQRGRPTASVVVFSDGVTTEGRSLSEAAALAGRRRVPLHCVGVGGERPPRDVRLSDLAADDSAFVGDLVVFQATLSATGYSGQKVKVRLVRIGGPRPSLLRRLLPGLSAEAAVAALEERALWARLGL